jgi:predicted nuclease of predicted toxin-antitoxin system
MRILADENFPGSAITALRERGHDVVWIRTGAPGSKDRDILQRAETENRVIVTFDKDFGEMAFRLKLPASRGVILFRITAISPQTVAQKVITTLEGRTDWLGHFSVVEDSRIRMRKMPYCTRSN